MIELDDSIEWEDQPPEEDLAVKLLKLEDTIKTMNEAISKLLNQVANLANKIDTVDSSLTGHVSERDAHHVAMVSKKK